MTYIQYIYTVILQGSKIEVHFYIRDKYHTLLNKPDITDLSRKNTNLLLSE